MKRVIYILAILIIAVSCDSILDEKVITQRTNENIFYSEGSSDAMLGGLYKSLNDWRYYTAQTFIGLTVNCVGYSSIKNRGNASMAILSQTSQNQIVQYTYEAIYASIAQANLLLANFPEELTSDVMKNTKGQVLFIRAINYFNLVRIFGRVPIVSKVPESDNDYAVPRAATDDIMYEFIISDALEAYNLLSENQSSVRAPKKAAALALLANIYLFRASKENKREYWEKAKEYALDVIESGVYSLQSNYSSLFDLNNEFNSESIFEINYIASGTSGLGNTFTFFLAPWFSHKWCYANQQNGVWPGDIFVVNRDLFDEMTEAMGGIDARMKTNFTIDKIEDTWNGTTKDWSITRTFYPNKSDTKSGEIFSNYTYIQKYKDGSAVLQTEHGTNFYVMRYAEMFLIYAESDNELNGPTQDGLDKLNEILSRSRNSTGGGEFPADIKIGDYDQDGLRWRIMTERKIEFAGELKLWFDERRRGSEYFEKLVKAHNARLAIWNAGAVDGWKDPTCFYDYPDNLESHSRNLLWPIPLSEINANDSISLANQNPGY